MTGLFLRPGGFAWLVAHEMRVAWRGRRGRGLTRLAGWIIGVLYVTLGFTIASTLVDTPLPWRPLAGTIVLAASVTAFTFMTAQAMLASQRTLYETRDLDLFFTAPLPERTVLLAKLIGIAATVVLSFATLLLPILAPVALLGHPRLFGVVGVLLALALAAAAVGLALTLGLARLAGPRAARTAGQIVAAMLGGVIFLVGQLANLNHRAGRGVFGWLREHGLGVSGASGWPGHAAFAAPGPLVAMLAVGLALFGAAGVILRGVFLSGYQDGAMRLGRPRPSSRGRAGGTARLFPTSLRGAVFAKEWRLLARDPALAFQVVLRLVYLAPMVLIGARNGVASVPTLAFASVLIAGQLAGSTAWLAISAEDAPELLLVAPVDPGLTNRVKLQAALAIAAPFAAVLPLVLLVLAPPAALVTLVLTVPAAWLSGLVELHLGKPGKRSGFAKRGQGSFVAGLLGILIAFAFGGAAAGASWWLQ